MLCLSFFCKVLQMFLFSSVFCNFTIFCILLTKLVVARHKASSCRPTWQLHGRCDDQIRRLLKSAGRQHRVHLTVENNQVPTSSVVGDRSGLMGRTAAPLLARPPLLHGINWASPAVRIADQCR